MVLDVRSHSKSIGSEFLDNCLATAVSTANSGSSCLHRGVDLSFDLIIVSRVNL